jgi:hypothetical protein
MTRTVQVAFMTLCLAAGCRSRDGFYVKSFNSNSGKIVLLRYRTNTTITASCLSTRRMKDPEPTDGFEKMVRGLCMNLPTHVGETLKEGKQKGEIDKTIAIYFHLDDAENETEIWSVDSEETR